MRSLTIQNCPFIHNVEKMSGPKRSIKIADHFTCTSANVICSISCIYRQKLYIAETGRRQGDQFREHRDMEEMTRTHPNPEVRLKSHCNLSLHLGSSKAVPKASTQFESQKNLEQKIYLLNRYSLYPQHQRALSFN